MRKFSFTSSHAHGAFKAAFPDYQHDESWIAVAKYLYGEDKWREELNLGEEQQVVEPNSEEDENGTEENEEEETQSSKLNPLSIQVYLSQLLENMDANDEEEDADALDWLKIYILSNVKDGESDEAAMENVALFEGTVIDNEDAASNTVNFLSPQQRKKVFSYLYGHVHPDYCTTKSNSKRDLILWLQKPNCIRNYLFYKAIGLKELMAARNLVLSGRCNKDDRIAALAGVLPSNRLVRQAAALPPPIQHQQGAGSHNSTSRSGLTAKDEAVRKVLEKSFLPFQKGESREHCSLGHRLEKPILKNWIAHVANDPDCPVPSIKVKRAYTAGLAAKKGMLYAKDSIDFVLVVETKTVPSELDILLQTNEDEQDSELEAWGFECKGRVVSRTALEEEQAFSATLFSKHNRIKDSEVFDLVRVEGERFQVLQHAFVYNFNTVVLAIADAHSELIQTTIIDYSKDLKSHFGKVLDDLKNLTLYWFYNDESAANTIRKRAQVVKIPNEIFEIAKLVKNINGSEALQGTVNLCKTLSSLPAPIPSFARLIPAIYAFWNAVKGGSDTTTKLMDSCKLLTPHSNMETVATSRSIMLLFVLNHRLFQLFSAKDNLNYYRSLYDYRRAACSRTTFHKSFLCSFNILKTYLHELNKENNEGFAISRNNLNAGQKKRVLPNRKRVNGVLPENVTFGATLPTTTPKKISASIHSGEASVEVKEMVRNCNGRVLKVHNNDNRKRCDYNRCQHKTSWYCVGCKCWLCVDRRQLKQNNKDKDLYTHALRGKMVVFQKQCYHKAHEACWNDNTRSST